MQVLGWRGWDVQGGRISAAGWHCTLRINSPGASRVAKYSEAAPHWMDPVPSTSICRAWHHGMTWQHIDLQGPFQHDTGTRHPPCILHAPSMLPRLSLKPSIASSSIASKCIVHSGDVDCLVKHLHDEVPAPHSGSHPAAHQDTSHQITCCHATSIPCSHLPHQYYQPPTPQQR